MLVSQLAPATNYPRVQSFVVQVLDMQFADVRAMLQLPRPDVGIDPGCNFAIVSTLCNLISGVSSTIYKPLSGRGSGYAFRELVRTFFPYTPSGAADFPKQLYAFCRNPLVHAVGLKNAASPIVSFTRVFDPSHERIGWSDKELGDLERGSFRLSLPGVVVQSKKWTIHCESFYLDVIDMIRNLHADTAQMQAAESRFHKGDYNWGH